MAGRFGEQRRESPCLVPVLPRVEFLALVEVEKEAFRGLGVERFGDPVARHAQHVGEPPIGGEAARPAGSLLVDLEGSGAVELGEGQRQFLQRLLARPHSERQKGAAVPKSSRPGARL